MRFPPGLAPGLGLLVALLFVDAVALRAQDVMLRPTVSPAPAPDSPPVTVVAGPEYNGGSFRRWALGSLYRDLWTAPITVPVLNPSRYRGGLRPVRLGGGFQTVTLHLRDASGRYYLFRSVNKLVNQGLGPDLRGTPLGWIVQDQTKSTYPLGAWPLTPILDAVGIRTPAPELYVMGDDPALGSARAQFAGMLGLLVESPDDGPDHTLRFQGADRVVGSEDLLDLLQKGPAHRVDSRALLVARLVDMLVGDSDRGFMQWRWLGYETDTGWIWEPSPLDRDAAFLMGDGLAAVATRLVLAKYVRFDDHIDVKGLTASQPEVDRLLLADLDGPVWDSIAAAVQAAVSDDVIARAVATLPEPYRDISGDFLTRWLRVRRADLPAAARTYYHVLARDVDVQATDVDELAVVQREAGGAVTVDLYGPPAERAVSPSGDGEAPAERRPYYHRRFLPEDTHELRVYLRGGADRAIVRGAGSEITVRVIGGPGNDVLVDSTSSGSTRFYDFQGDDRFAGRAGEDADRRAWTRRAWSEYQMEHVKSSRDFGVRRSWRPTVDFKSGPGVIVGIGRRRDDFGFRRLPYASRMRVTALVGVENAGLGGEIKLRHWGDNGRIGLHLDAQGGWKLWGARFHGFGNDATDFAPTTTTTGHQVVGWAYVEVPFGDLGALGSFSIGPEVRWSDPGADQGSALAALRPLGWTSFGSVGLSSALEFDRVDRVDIPHRGLKVRAEASVSPALWDAPDWFGNTQARVWGYLPAGWTTVTLRGGGEWAGGDFPFESAAYIGGGSTVRGFDYNRYAGDTALDGGVEWHVPVTRLKLITRGDLGVMGLVDTGRVWLDGDSPGGWHTGVGGGIWYRTLGAAGSVAVAYGESTKVYFEFEAPGRLKNLVQIPRSGSVSQPHR